MSTLATPEGTAAFADDADLAEVGYTTLGRTGLTTSRLGFGTYRVDDRAPEHKEALTKALLAGVNLVDTSTNYADGHSETLVGQVLGKLFEAGKLDREEVIVVSKVGYVQGENLALAKDREAAGNAVPEMVHYMDGCWHCLHPTWIEDQLSRSLLRTGLAALDAYLLHNPEYFLSDARKHRPKAPLAEVRAQFHDRVRRAFEKLEELCDAGKLGCYGVSSNTFGAPLEDPEATSLSAMLGLAREVAKARTGDPERHRFSIVQLPLNLFEANPQAVKKDDGETVLAYAAKHGLAVLANRPLNAFRGERLHRLADPPQRTPRTPFPEAIEEVQALEAIFAQDFAPKIRVEGKGPRPEQIFRWGKELAQAPQRLAGIDAWNQLQAQVIGPEVNGALNALAQGFKADVEFHTWAKRYAETLSHLLEAVTAELFARARVVTDKLAAEVAAEVPAWKGATLSRQAIATLLATPGVTSVLVGMRRAPYVDDALGAVGLPPPPEGAPARIYARLAK